MNSVPALRYSLTARVLHWTTAVLVITVIVVGLLLDDLPAGRVQNTAYDLHRSTGVLIFVLVAIRLLYRWTHPPPPLPADVPRLQRLAANAVHHLLYTLLLVQPLVGWWGTSAYGAAINVYWLFTLPPLVAKDQAWGERILGWHGVIGITIACVIAVHVGAALYHRFVRKDGVLQRML